MHGAIRAAGFSLMTMFVSCGVGAQDLDTRIGKIAMAGELPAHDSALPPASFDKPWKIDDITAVE